MKARIERTIYVCSACGRSYSRWQGRCLDCGEWNCLIEEKVATGKRTKHTGAETTTAFAITLCNKHNQSYIQTGMEEFDLLLGGGLIPASALLIGGEPGIGKSTLILQVAGKLAEQGINSLYLSGEESVQQVGHRGQRLGVGSELIKLAAVRELPQIYSLIQKEKPKLVVIDSAQTLYDPELESAPGTVSQIKSAGAELIDYCKHQDILLILIAHITKDGAIAGPKVLEHLVDCVLYFEGEMNNLHRILRVRKNRFGPASEIGIFRIDEWGLSAVANPSELFLDSHLDDVSGRAVVAAIAGQRALLLEMQALATPTNYGFPQRIASGFDLKRLHLLIAIIEKRLKIALGQKDVFVNIAGGLKISDPALDLALIAALVSSIEDIPIKPGTAVMGEVGLSGEVRSLPYADRRLLETAKLGFKRLILPHKNLKGLPRQSAIKLVGISRLGELAEAALV